MKVNECRASGHQWHYVSWIKGHVVCRRCHQTRSTSGEHRDVELPQEVIFFP